MASRFVNIDRDTPLLLPPDLLGFRRFLLRSLEQVSLAWTLVTLAYNLKRLHHLGPVLKKAWPFCLAAWRTKSDTLLDKWVESLLAILVGDAFVVRLGQYF